MVIIVENSSEIPLEEGQGCIIYGVDTADSFKPIYVSVDEVESKSKDIYENPQNYSEFAKGSSDAFYKFLKYLWVTFPDGIEKRLMDIAV